MLHTGLLPFVFIALAAAPIEENEATTLAALWRSTTQVEVTDSGMTFVAAPQQQHVLVARVSAEGDLDTACAVGEEAVRALLLEHAATTETSKER